MKLAQNAYEYYSRRLLEEPGYRQVLIKELEARWEAMHPQNRPEADKKAKVEFKKDISGKEYICRGDNAGLLRESGRPVVLDRLAVMAVSVFHLSHWRTDVTVKNYLV